jgi:integrase
MDPKRYTAMRDAARNVRSHFGSLKAWRDEESYCAVLLELAWHTSRRINAILHLRKEDYKPDVGEFGAVYWRADSDKTHRSGLTPLNAEAQRAIEEQLARALPGEWLFPAPMKPEDPLSKATARQWFLRAEEIAKLDHIPGGGWHMARRGFVTLRKGQSEADLAALGGWANPKVMRRVYQASDFTTMSEVVRNPIPDEE